jgi:acyl-CoA carboxylase subunit beta
VATVAQDWVVCEGCHELLYGRRLARSLGVCPACGAHRRLTAPERLAQLLDPGSARVLDPPPRTVDVLEFTDSRPYPVRLAEARVATGLAEGVLLATGRVEGHPLVVAAMDFRFLGGSLGAAVGDLVTSAAELALHDRLPLLIVSASGGARMQEGAIALMQMARTSQAIGRLDEAGILTISLVTDPTYGGVAASYATLCDVILAEPGARMGLAGPRVIEQTIRQRLPKGFQTAEFLVEHGLIDGVRRRQDLRAVLGRLLAAHGAGRLDAPAVSAPDDARVVERDHRRLPDVDAWRTVQMARDRGRPTTLDLAASVLDGFEELRGDRMGGEDPAIVGGIARLDGRPLMVIGHQKGHSLRELTARGFGMPAPAGYRKAARLMRTAAKLGLPVVTIVDTPGAHPGVESEAGGQAVAMAESIRLMAGLPVPIVTLIAGEGGSGGALALAVADEVLILSNAIYSVISPEGCASILWRDAGQAPAAAAALRLDARQLLRLGVVDGVVREPDGGAQADPRLTARRVHVALSAALRRLDGRSGDELVARRRARFRAFGATGADGPPAATRPAALAAAAGGRDG